MGKIEKHLPSAFKLQERLLAANRELGPSLLRFTIRLIPNKQISFRTIEPMQEVQDILPLCLLKDA